MHEHISPLLGEHPRIMNIILGPVTVHYREVSLYLVITTCLSYSVESYIMTKYLDDLPKINSV